MNRKRPLIDEEFVGAIAAAPFETAAAFYAERLTENAKAVAFLKAEMQISLEDACALSIGFSDRCLGKRLPTRDSLRGRTLRAQLVELGLFKTSGHEALRGCITLPLLDEEDAITGIEGRRIDRHGKGPAVIKLGSGTLHLPPQPCEPIIESSVVDLESSSKVTHTADSAPQPGSISDLIIEDEQVTFVRDDRRYRVRGMQRNTNVWTLRVNLMASRDGLVHLDTLDLAKARSRVSFIKAAATELFVDVDLVKKDIGQLLLKLEALREQQIAEAKSARVKTVELTDKERSDALELLRDADLLQRIVDDMEACGIVGERTNKVVGYLAATSRKLPQPLAIMIQSSSSAGKTSLMDAVLAMIPEEEQLRFTGMTGQSLFYLDSGSIQNKVLAISEEEGIAEAACALNLLQSEGRLRHATVVRDQSGNMVTRDHTVDGPVQIMLTTTALDIDEELLNRCLVLSVDESRKQTGEIQAMQRNARTLSAMVSSQNAIALQKLHQNAQRLLRPLRVVNPFAPQLRFANDKTRTRRDQLKYLTLIESVALLHQYQRTVRSTEVDGQAIEYVCVAPSDIEVANRLCAEILGHSLDELAPQTRHLLSLLERYVSRQAEGEKSARSAVRFTRRQVREFTGMSDFQVHKHLTRLVELEYLIACRGKQGSRYRYELLYDGEGQGGSRFVMGLIDPKKLQEPGTTTSLSRPSRGFSPDLAPGLGAISENSRGRSAGISNLNAESCHLA